jgi:hypothetical protein
VPDIETKDAGEPFMLTRNLIFLAVAVICVVLPMQASANVIWVGGSSTDVFEEANWDLSGSAVTIVDPNVSIMDDVLIGPGPFANDPVIPDVSGQQRLQLGDGYTLTVDSALLSVAGNDGVGGEPGSANGPTVDVINGAQFNPFFVVNDVLVNIDAVSSATFGGGGNPINLSTLDLTPGASLAFLAEDPAAYVAEHLSKTFVSGSPAVDGVNITIASDGAAGSVITAIPEPSSLVLACLAALVLLGRRRRR